MVVEASVGCWSVSLVPVCQYLLSDLEPFQRPDLLLAEDFPADSLSPVLFPSLPLSFTSGTDVNSEVGGNHVLLSPPSLRGGADSLIPTPYSHKQRGSVPGQKQTFIAKWRPSSHKRSAMASVLIRRTENSQKHSPAPSLCGQLVLPREGYISSTLMRTCRQPEIRMCLRAGP